jgi:hypothetical protein
MGRILKDCEIVLKGIENLKKSLGEPLGRY